MMMIEPKRLRVVFPTEGQIFPGDTVLYDEPRRWWERWFDRLRHPFTTPNRYTRRKLIITNIGRGSRL